MARRSKRLSERLIGTFDAACVAEDLVVAARLLMIAEILLRDPALSGRERGGMLVDLTDAHGRLWLLRHPEETLAPLLPTL